ncbi:MAG: hypothetical protein U0230_17965 [Polyangiales bacterium]
MKPLVLGFRGRPEPLGPSAVVAFDEVALRLARRLLDADDERLSRLRGVGGDGTLAILGDERDLPWEDGVIYLGTEEADPSICVPTTLEPDVPSGWLASIVDARGSLLPLALVPRAEGLDVISLREARPLARAKLAAFVEPSP